MTAKILAKAQFDVALHNCGQKFACKDKRMRNLLDLPIVLLARIRSSTVNITLLEELM